MRRGCRSGWGVARPFADEIFCSVRFGRPAATIHGHADGSARTDYGYGSRLPLTRTGWRTTQAHRDETMLTTKLGAGRDSHSHADGGSLTLYGLGARLLLDSGEY